MSVDLYAIKGASSTSTGVSTTQQWTRSITLGKNLKDFYATLGDVTISSPTQISTLSDGPMKVVRYGALTVNSSLTVSNRCRGLIVICDSLTIGASGSISMTGKGPLIATNSLIDFPFEDVVLPNSVSATSSKIKYSDFTKAISDNGYCFFDKGLWNGNFGLGYGVQISQGTGYTIVSSAGLGTGGAGTQAAGQSYRAGGPGGAGSNGGLGGGGGGGAGVENINQVGCQGSPGGAATPYASGCGGDGTYNGTIGFSAIYSVGGLVNASRSPAGLLIVIVNGNINIASGGSINSNGTTGGGSGWGAGGSSGGGSVFVGYGGTLTNNGSITASAGITTTAGGASGGAGSTTLKTFTQIGGTWI